MTAEIRNPNPVLATSRLNGCDILVTPTPELNMRKSLCSYTRDLLLGRKIGEQRVETNYRIHNTRLSSDDSRAQAQCVSFLEIRPNAACSWVDACLAHRVENLGSAKGLSPVGDTATIDENCTGK